MGDLPKGPGRRGARCIKVHRYQSAHIKAPAQLKATFVKFAASSPGFFAADTVSRFNCLVIRKNTLWAVAELADEEPSQIETVKAFQLLNR